MCSGRLDGGIGWKYHVSIRTCMFLAIGGLIGWSMDRKKRIGWSDGRC